VQLIAVERNNPVTVGLPPPGSGQRRSELVQARFKGAVRPVDTDDRTLATHTRRNAGETEAPRRRQIADTEIGYFLPGHLQPTRMSLDKPEMLIYPAGNGTPQPTESRTPGKAEQAGHPPRQIRAIPPPQHKHHPNRIQHNPADTVNKRAASHIPSWHPAARNPKSQTPSYRHSPGGPGICYRPDYLVTDRWSTATPTCDGATRSWFRGQTSLARSVIGSSASQAAIPSRSPIRNAY
jgi:hypothetical protein